MRMLGRELFFDLLLVLYIWPMMAALTLTVEAFPAIKKMPVENAQELMWWLQGGYTVAYMYGFAAWMGLA